MASRVRIPVRPRPTAWRSAFFALCLILLVALGAGGTSAQAHPVGVPSAGRAADPAPGDGGPATDAYLLGPAGLALDNAGHLYIADRSDQRVRVVDLHTGIISTAAGDGETGQGGDGGLATLARLAGPEAVALDGSHLYIAATDNPDADVDTDNPDAKADVRVVDLQTGLISTFAGTGERGDSGDGGPAAYASFMSIGDLALDGAGQLYIGDYGADRVRVVDLRTGIISPVTRGVGAAALAIDTSRTHLYVADDNRSIVSVVDLRTGAVTRIAGGGSHNLDGVPATRVQLHNPHALALDKAERLYIADQTDVRVVDLHSGAIATIAGTGTYGDAGDGGPAHDAQLENVDGLALDNAGHLYIADYDAGRVRVVDLGTGIISAVAGGGSPDQQSTPEPTATPEPRATPEPPRVRVAGLALPGNVAADRWAPLFHQGHPGVPITVAPSDSVHAVDALSSSQADLAVRSARLTPTQHGSEDDACAPDAVLRVPVALDATALVARLPGLTQPLRVTPSILAALFDGSITSWDDPRLAVLNPGVVLPVLAVHPLYRADGDRTTDILRTYLRRVSHAWRAAVNTVGVGAWPAGRGVSGAAALARAIAATPGAVGYLDLTDARATHLPLLALSNRSGRYITASPASVVAAAFAAGSDVRVGRTPDLLDTVALDAYPLAYTIEADACGGSSAEAGAVAAYLQAALSMQGQAAVAQAGEGALPPSLRAAALARIAATTTNRET